jgi:putative DNA primase/helicase
MNLVQLAAKLGGKINGPWINIRGSGHSKDDLSLGIRFDSKAPDGLIVHSFAGDDPSNCRKYVKEKLKDLHKLHHDTLEVDDKVQEPTKTQGSAFALRLWAEALPVEGTPAAVYLTSRGCAPTTRTSWPPDLRFHPACPFGTFNFPTLIGLTLDVVTGEPAGIHRTALSDDGVSKRVRKPPREETAGRKGRWPSGLQPKMMLARISQTMKCIEAANQRN